MIKTIAFDMGGVLIKSRKKRIQEKLAKELNIKKRNWIEIIRPIIKLSSKGKITRKKTLSNIKKILKENNKKLENALKIFYKRAYKINKDMLALSKKIKKMKYKVIIISNLAHFAKEILVENKNMKHFEERVISCDIRSSKPSRKLFQIALKKSNTKPNEMIFIDNSQNNIEAAEKIGIKSILFKNNKQVIKDLERALKPNI